MSNRDRPQAPREHMNLFDRAATCPTGTAPQTSGLRRTARRADVSDTTENLLTDDGFDALAADGTPGPAEAPGPAGRPAGTWRDPPPYGQADHARVTPAGADWLASASLFPRSVHALWRLRPAAPSVLPCGTAFDVVSTSPLFGRRLLDRLWGTGPGSGPVAVHRGRMLLFTAPGTASRLPTLLNWEEWQIREPPSATARHPREPGPAHPPYDEPACGTDGSEEGLTSLLCHGPGDAVTVPALDPRAARAVPGSAEGARPASRWLVAPGVRHPWLPGAESLLWACFSADRSEQDGGARGASGTPHPPFPFRAGRSGTGGRTIDFRPGGSWC